MCSNNIGLSNILSRLINWMVLGHIYIKAYNFCLVVELQKFDT